MRTPIKCALLLTLLTAPSAPARSEEYTVCPPPGSGLPCITVDKPERPPQPQPQPQPPTTSTGTAPSLSPDGKKSTK